MSELFLPTKSEISYECGIKLHTVYFENVGRFIEEKIPEHELRTEGFIDQYENLILPPHGPSYISESLKLGEYSIKLAEK